MKDRHGHKKLTAFTLRLMGEIGGWIAAPVLVLGWIGKKIDVILETRPAILVASLLLSFVVSTVAVCVRAADFGDQYEQLTDGPPKETGDPVAAGSPPGPPEGRAG
jgi:F0F1-type ATP synthase assembly protein I